MLRKVLKGVGALIGVVAALALFALLALYVITEERLNRVHSIQAAEVQVPDDQAAVERGRHIVRTRGFCSDCHGANLAGQYFDDGPLIGLISMKNLTSGKGGIAQNYSDEDWVRAIRHGVGKEGKPLLDMPSNFYNEFSDQDLGDIIAYLKTLPPVDNELPEKRLGPLGRFYVLTTPSLLAANVIDHDAARTPPPQPEVSVAYGEYLATSCRFCHGEDLSGGLEPGAGLNLTPGGNLGHWSEGEFLQTIRTGVTPDGNELNRELMPWDKIAEMRDEDLKAIWLYLQTLPPVQTANQNPSQ
jgi:mono/diheme cytochrome c family protein